jgi:general secretion pathway protein F
MPAYKYEALNASGRALTGLIEADNARAARAQLRAKELVPMQVTQVAHANEAARAGLFERRTFNATLLAVWTRQLAGLVSAGLPIERALTALADESEDQRQRELVAQLKSEVNGGASFASARIRCRLPCRRRCRRAEWRAGHRAGAACR